jgi:peptidoglycan/xylan/chitin deacetylase (PgdA/CDA1 family)
MTTVCLSFDFDGMAIWVSTFRQATPTPLSRGEYGARVGVPRILALLESCAVPATFFVPAHTAASFPDAVAAIHGAGHEIACHGYVHESPVGLEPGQEAVLLDRSIDALTRATGTRPLGYRSPAWDLSPQTLGLLEARGLLYDSSLMADDFRPYYPRHHDQVGEDGLVRGQPGTLVEFPVAWELDDYPYFHFASKPINQGLRDTDEVLRLWRAEFDYCHEEVPDGTYTLTMHPEIIGRGPRIRMLGQLLEHIGRAGGVRFSTMSAQARALAGRVGGA